MPELPQENPKFIQLQVPGWNSLELELQLEADQVIMAVSKLSQQLKTREKAHITTVWEQLTVEEGIEVLITVEIKTRVFTTGAVCFRGKAHLENTMDKVKGKRSWPSQLTPLEGDEDRKNRQQNAKMELFAQ